MTTRYLMACILLITLASCVEEFQPDVDEFSGSLVVDGYITNDEGPYTIKLSVTNGLDYKDIKSASGAKVSILEEGGDTEQLAEINPGVYQSSPNGIRGTVGNRYKLLVQYNGKTFESNYELLKEPTTIDSVYSSVEYQATFDSPEEIPGVQFEVNTGISPYEEDYFLWKLEGTYKYHVGLLIFYYWNGSLHEFDDHDSLYYCYRTYGIQQVITGTTENITAAKIQDKPLYFLAGTDEKLTERYSLLTTQYTISKEAYEFWHAVEKQTKNGGSLYTTQPYQIKGNVQNVNDPDDTVLGYFMAAGVSRNRIFVDPSSEVGVEIEPCVPDGMGLIALPAFGPEYWPYYLPGGDAGTGMVDQECVDCRTWGGVVEKPDFWIE